MSGLPSRNGDWKSDTQGYDELIISLTPMEVWEPQ